MYSWLRDNDFINNGDMMTTHTLMSGGVVGVPDDRYEDFLCLYAKEVEGKNRNLSFSELRSDPIFCMYFDVDLLDTCVVGQDVSRGIFSLIQTVVRGFYSGDRTDERFLCVVCGTSTKEVAVEDRVLTKNGYHIIFPNLRVNLSQALQLRHSVVYELEKTMGARPEHLNAWSDVIDKAPYASGLKMCGSFKRLKCTDCKKVDSNFKDKKKAMLSSIARLRKKIHPREPGFDYADLGEIHADEFKDAVFCEMYGKYLELTGFNSCRTCLNTGKTTENRTYMPSLVLDGGGDEDTSLLDILSEDYVEVMKYTSIRCQEGVRETAGFEIPKGVPRAPTEQNGANLRTFASTRLTHLGKDMHAFTVSNDLYLSDAMTMQSWKGPPVEDPGRLSVIERFIRECICEEYASVQIRKVCETQLIKRSVPKTNGGSKLLSALVEAHSGTTPASPAVTVRNRYLVNVAGVGSTYCMNKGGEHTSNSVYFIITPSHCYQRCFSRKADIRLGGTTCAEYRSGGVPVPVWVSTALFPDEAQTKPGEAVASLLPLAQEVAAPSNPLLPGTRKLKKRRRKTGTDWGTKKL